MNIITDKSLFIKQANSLITNEKNLITNLSNLSALYKEYLPNTNWVGFYIVDKEQEQYLKEGNIQKFFADICEKYIVLI